MSNKQAFTAQTDYFSKFCRVTAFDFLGFGQSPALKEPFSVTDYAAWTKELLARLGVVRPHLIAHSFGVRVAVKMAAENGLAFDKMLLTGPAGIICNRGIVYHAKVRAYKLTKRIFPNYAQRRFGSEEYKTLPPVMRQSYIKIVNEDLRKTATRVENETLIVQGKSDLTTTRREAEIYLEHLKRGKLVLMEGGHFAFAEHPLAFNLLAEEFFFL